jgi:hypothetical protein
LIVCHFPEAKKQICFKQLLKTRIILWLLLYTDKKKKMSKLVRCINCGQKYDPKTSIGALQCRIHPLGLNIISDGNRYERFHMECCGASNNPSDIHYEISTPKGCVKIDHFSSEEEYRSIREKPFVFFSKEDYYKKKINVSSQSEIVQFNTINSVTRDFKFELPPRGNLLTIDVVEAYNNHIQKHKKIKTVDDLNGDYFKDTESLYNYSISSIIGRAGDVDKVYEGGIEQEDFTPFILMRRISKKQCCLKVSEVSSHLKNSSCKCN